MNLSVVLAVTDSDNATFWTFRNFILIKIKQNSSENQAKRLGDSVSRVWYNLIRLRRPIGNYGPVKTHNVRVPEAGMSTPDRSDWPLLALEAAEDGALTPVQMQKVLFLLSKQALHLISTDFYDFEAYNYGPFSSQIYRDLAQNAREGKIVYDGAPNRNWSRYVITAQGKDRAYNVMAEVDPEVRDYLRTIVGWAKSLPFSELIGAIYKAYPEYAVNSIFSPRRSVSSLSE